MATLNDIPPSTDVSPNIDKEGEVEDLIAQLCLDAPSDPIKFCLRLYQHGKSLSQLEKDFEREKKPALLATAEYLKIPNCESKVKKPLAHMIICRIQNLLPENCTLCSERYRIDLNDEPILECSICGQGVHKVCWMRLASAMSNVDDLTVGQPLSDIDKTCFRKLYNPLNLPGLYYICDFCKDTTIPNDEDGNSKKLKQKGNIKDTSDLHQSQPQSSHDHAQSQSVMNNCCSTDHISDSQESHLITTNNQSGDPQIPDIDDPPPNDHKENEKSQTICKFFKNSKCRHGMKGKGCNFTHPNVCLKFTQNGTRQPRGCNLGKKCTDFHPAMCINSLRKGECFSQSCKFNHIRGTKRHPPQAKTNENNSDNSKPTEVPIQNSNQSQPNAQGNNFLEVIRLLKAELLQSMELKMSSLTNQIQQLQQNSQTNMNPQNYPANLPNSIRLPLNQNHYPISQPALGQASPVRHQFSVPPPTFLPNQIYPLPARLPMPNQQQ